MAGFRSAAAAARAHGWAIGTYAGHENGHRGVTLQAAERYARAYHVKLRWLLGLEEDAGVPDLHHLHGQVLAVTESMVAPVDGSGEEDPSKRYIEMLEVEPSAGGGSHIEDAPVRGRLAFRRAWLNLHALIASECVVIRVRGESMEPTLPDKCSILVAKHRNRRRDKHIFVVRTEDGLIVKRARKDGKSWLLVSDHPAWKDLPWPRDADVIGEVVWMAKTLG